MASNVKMKSLKATLLFAPVQFISFAKSRVIMRAVTRITVSPRLYPWVNRMCWIC